MSSSLIVISSSSRPDFYAKPSCFFLAKTSNARQRFYIAPLMGGIFEQPHEHGSSRRLGSFLSQSADKFGKRLDGKAGRSADRGPYYGSYPTIHDATPPFPVLGAD